MSQRDLARVERATKKLEEAKADQTEALRKAYANGEGESIARIAEAAKATRQSIYRRLGLWTRK